MKTLEDILARHPFWNNLPPQYFPLLIECAVIELRVGGIMLQRLQATRMRLLDICEVSQ